MSFLQVALLANAILLIFLLLALELRWWRLRKGEVCNGVVVGQEKFEDQEGDVCYFPIIVAESGEKKLKFRSNYSRRESFLVGEAIPVLWNPQSQKAEWMNRRHRHEPTIALGILSAVCAVLAFIL